MRNVVIVAACRTPIGTIGGQFKTLTATEFSIPVMQNLIKRSLIYEMKKRGDRYGVATLCAGGGMGTAVVIENC